MSKFLYVGLTVTNGQVLLPCNIHRILDCYDASDSIIDYKLNTAGSYLTTLTYQSSGETYDQDTLYLNYAGTIVDVDTGYPMIMKGHEQACETFCKIKAFEEQALYQKIDPRIFDRWSFQLSGQIANAKQNPYRHKTRQDLQNLEIIRANVLPVIGRVALSHKLYRDNGMMIEPYID